MDILFEFEGYGNILYAGFVNDECKGYVVYENESSAALACSSSNRTGFPVELAVNVDVSLSTTSTTTITPSTLENTLFAILNTKDIDLISKNDALF